MAKNERKVHPRTRAMHDEWRMRSIRKRDNRANRYIAGRNDTKVATVLAINEQGDVLLDRFTNEDGEGIWLKPQNGITPRVGGAMAYTNLEGSPMALGGVGGGDLRIMPDLAAWNTFDELLMTPNQGWMDQARIPILQTRQDKRLVQIGGGFYIDPHLTVIEEMFESAVGGRYQASGSGSSTFIKNRELRLTTGASSLDKRYLYWATSNSHAGIWASAFTEWELLFSVSSSGFVGNSVNRVGVFPDITQSVVTDGVFIEWHSNTFDTRCYAIMGSSYLFSGVLVNDNAGSPNLYRISCRRPYYAENDASRVFTFQRMASTGVGHYLIDAAGDFVVEYELNSGVVEPSMMLSGVPGAFVQTLTTASKNFSLHWFKGYCYHNEVHPW